MKPNSYSTMVCRYVLCALLLLAGGCARISPPSDARPVMRTLTVTGYCKCGSCCSWDRNWLLIPVHTSGPGKGQRKVVGMTASGRRVRHGTIAADTALFPFGTVMYVEGYGFGVVEDTGGAVRGETIDLYFSSHRRALLWGRKNVKVQVWIPDVKYGRDIAALHGNDLQAPRGRESNAR